MQFGFFPSYPPGLGHICHALIEKGMGNSRLYVRWMEQTETPMQRKTFSHPLREISHYVGICRLPSIVIFRTCQTFSNHIGIFSVVSPLYPQ
jgi:hypothetical protein